MSNGAGAGAAAGAVEFWPLLELERLGSGCEASDDFGERGRLFLSLVKMAGLLFCGSWRSPIRRRCLKVLPLVKVPRFPRFRLRGLGWIERRCRNRWFGHLHSTFYPR